MPSFPISLMTWPQSPYFTFGADLLYTSHPAVCKRYFHIHSDDQITGSAQSECPKVTQQKFLAIEKSTNLRLNRERNTSQRLRSRRQWVSTVALAAGCKRTRGTPASWLTASWPLSVHWALKRNVYISSGLQLYLKNQRMNKKTCWNCGYPQSPIIGQFLLILDHSYLVGKLTSSKIADTKVPGF
jgi:hypothetical protein